ncbi:MAG: hypothetical protein GY757_35450, partial [bacterium]|nr:hypothetical protein [bacterium]
EHLNKHLPAYMVPSYFLPLENIPLSSNGKINRKALPKPGVGDTIRDETHYREPQNELQKQMTTVWRDVLGRERIGIDDNFINIGGDSIQAIQIASRLNREGYKLDIAHIFKYLTIDKISGSVEKKIQEIDQNPVEGIIRHSPIQKWFMKRKLTGKHHWNLAFMLYKETGFETENLKKVLEQMVRHHDILRAVLTPGEEAMI